MVGDVRNISNGKRLNTNAQQKISGWSHGKQVDYLTYKLTAEGIALERQSEAYSTKTCPLLWGAQQTQRPAVCLRPL